MIGLSNPWFAIPLAMVIVIAIVVIKEIVISISVDEGCE